LLSLVRDEIRTRGTILPSRIANIIIFIGLLHSVSGGYGIQNGLTLSKSRGAG
jgi:hypothetical protein